MPTLIIGLAIVAGLPQLVHNYLPMGRRPTRRAARLLVRVPVVGNGLQTAGCSPGALALRQCTPPRRTRSRWGDVRGRIPDRARRPAVRHVTFTPARSTTFDNFSTA